MYEQIDLLYKPAETTDAINLLKAMYRNADLNGCMLWSDNTTGNADDDDLKQSNNNNNNINKNKLNRIQR
jgi:hypothetical protein